MSYAILPVKNTSTHGSLNAGDPDVDTDEFDDDDQSSEVSAGGNLRGDLEQVLKGDFDFKGRFAFSQTFASTPPPGLHIEGIGVIGFPLSERDAKLIEATAIQAPFGKGTQTVVDTTVRNTLEINPKSFSFKNPAWSEFFQTVVEKVAIGLGLPQNLPPPRADLYKLLLYKPGSHFLPHKDTEKSQGMFASLIIVLPSKFEGGQVHVSHGNYNDIFDTSPSSEFTTSALAWYTDVTHQVKPVTSGYRLALSYNLVNTSPGIPPPHLPDMHSAVSAVENIFRKWKKGAYDEPGFSGTITYLLDHEYSQASLELAALKGKDATLVSNIRAVAQNHGISLRLGLLECMIYGEAEYSSRSYSNWDNLNPKMDQVHEKTYTIKDLYDLEGDLVEGDVTFDPKLDMIPQDPGFDGQEPDDEEFEGYTGNEGAPMTYWYRRSVLIMCLAKEVSGTLLRIGGTEYALTKLQRWKAEGPTERNKQMVQYILDHGHLGNSWSRTFTQETLFLIDLALKWGDLAIWQETLQKSTSSGTTPQISLDVLIQAWSVFTFDPIKPSIELTLRHQPSTKAAIEFINSFRDRVPTQDPNVVAWWKQQTAKVFSSIKPQPTVGDVQVFISFAKSEGLRVFEKTVVKQLIGFRQLFDFWVGLAEGLSKNRNKLTPTGGDPEKTSKYLNRIIDSLIGAAIPEYKSTAPYIPFSIHARTETQGFTRILQLLDLMALTRRTHHSGRLITSVSQPEGNVLVHYKNFITLFVPKLKARYKQYNRSEFPMLDAFLRALVEGWLQNLLGNPSSRAAAITNKLACECQDCERFNRFLRSDAVTETLRALQKRRLHVESIIRRSIPGIVTCTTITHGSPHTLQVTKTQGILAMGGWDTRVGSARAFLSLVGTPDVLARIMGGRHQDVEAALAGTKPYKLSKPVPVTAPAENTPIASASTARAGPSGTQIVPVIAGVKRKAEDDGVIDLSSD